MERKQSGNIIRRAIVLCVALLFLLCTVGCDIHIELPKAPQTGGSDEPVEVTGVTISVSSAEISVGATLLFSARPLGEECEWVSSDDAVASVEDGRITALSMGETAISVVEGSEMTTVFFTVKPQTLGTRSIASDAFLAVGDTVVFTAGLPEGYEAAWSSSDETVVSVLDGAVTACGEGEAEITAEYEEFSAAYTFTVLRADSNAEPEKPVDPVEPDDPDVPVDPDEPETPEKPEKPARLLIWSDEFDGDTLDESKWEYQLGVQDVYQNGNLAYGPWFWGNNELQFYTREAVSLADGILSITAERRDGLEHGRQFTSARIATRDRGFWTYGYFEARMKLPVGTGMWPAFWLLPQPEKGMGTDNRYGGWAYNGEVDIMEAKGRLPYEVGNTLHFGGNPSTYVPHTARLVTSIAEWHTYGLEWRSDYIAWFVDGWETFRIKNTSWYTNSSLGKDNPSAPFDVPFYIIINLAVGGNYDGGRAPDASFTSAAMQIDYVRVYA